MLDQSKIKRIVGYGCSFTAAEETADAEMCEMTEEEMDEWKRNNPLGKLYEIKEEAKPPNHYNWEKKRRAKNIENSYIRFLADKIEVPWVNRAEPGSSNKNSLYRLNRDLVDNDIKPGDLIIIGLTTLQREFWLQCYSTLKDRHRVFNYFPEDQNDPLVIDRLEKEYNYYTAAFEFYLNCKFIENLSKDLEKKEIYVKQIPVVDPPVAIKNNLTAEIEKNSFIAGNPDDDDPYVLTRMFSEFEKFESMCLDIGPLYVKDTNNLHGLHGWKHPKTSLHRKFADTLYDALILGKTPVKNSSLLSKLENLRLQDPFIYD